MDKLRKIRDLFLLFIIFAVLGWIYEVVLTLAAYGYFENRGFLFGPWLPIYGIGGLGLYAAFGRIACEPVSARKRALRILILFVCISVLAALFELASSYILDAVGIGFRSLWFYDEEPLNFDGRVSLISSVRFGIIGVLALYLAVPLWKRLTERGSNVLLDMVSGSLAILLLTDLAIKIIIKN
jgi:uncharacterized membrane protein